MRDATGDMHLLRLPIIKRRSVAEGVTEITLDVGNSPFDFAPGQFVRAILPELKGPDPRGASRDFSICSLPGENIRIAFRTGDMPSGFKRTLLSLPLGTQITVSGPHGNMMLPSSTARPLVCVAGGIGVTAFIGKIRHALLGAQRITLLWGGLDERTVPYVAQLRDIARVHAKQFTLVELFGGRIGTAELAPYAHSDSLWQLAGPPEMVRSVRAGLDALGVRARDMQDEEYGGYGEPPKPAHVDSPLAALHDLDKAAHMSAPLFEGLLEALNKTAIVSKTDAEGTILFVNDKFVEVSKYSREELIGQNHRILKSNHHPPEFYRDLWRTISSGHIWRGEIKNRAKDGSHYWVDTSIAPIVGDAGVPERYVSVRFVITDKKQVEEELSMYRQNLEKLVEERTNALSAANEALRQEDRKKDEFIAVLSHELRNPLSPAISSMELIKLQGADHPHTREVVETAHTHLKTIARLLDDLLDVSRITRKKFRVQKEALVAQTILGRAVESVRPFAENKRQSLTLSLPDEPLWLQADPVRLAQIFGNVLSNAVKYTQAGGSIAVTCRRERELVRVEVHDNGSGIAPDMLERIFDMFVQAKTTSDYTTTGAGLGIGLSLAKKLVELHGGSIEARSEGEGRGSAFLITLPAAASLQLPIRLRTAAPFGGTPERRFRVLVVDDNESAAKSLGMLLEKRGHRVGLAHHWSEALKESGNGYDALLLDIGMSEMNGYDLARLIAREVHTPPALIALTGYGQDEDKRKAEEAGFAFHLTKPVGLVDVERALVKVVPQAAGR